MPEICHLQQDLPQAERLDVFLVRKLPHLSRSRIQALIKNGLVNVEGKVITKAGYSLAADQTVIIELPDVQPYELVPEAIPLDIIFENEQLLVVNKPAGMVVHPAVGHDQGTLVHAVLAHLPNLKGIGGVQRPGVVHRLDKDTSGLIIFAKDDASHHWLQLQFKERKVHKTYIALVDGHPPTPSGRIDAAIGRDPSKRKQMSVVPDSKGREAQTQYRTLEQFENHTLLEVHPETGRTHQIRVHLAFLGCPIAADTVYGFRKKTLPLKRHFLHAQDLEIALPGAKRIEKFHAPLAADLEKVLTSLRNERSR